jgi:hypothetical protein
VGLTVVVLGIILVLLAVGFLTTARYSDKLRKVRRVKQAEEMAKRVQKRNIQRKPSMSSDFESTTNIEIRVLHNERVHWLCCCSDFGGHVVMLLMSSLFIGISVSILQALKAAYTISPATQLSLIALSALLSAWFLCNLCGLCTLWGFTVTRRLRPFEFSLSLITRSIFCLNFLKRYNSSQLPFSVNQITRTIKQLMLSFFIKKLMLSFFSLVLSQLGTS